MNHLHRELAPVSSVAWDAIEREVRRALTTFLVARRLVDFSGPHGYALSAVDLGRTGPAHEVPGEGVSVAVRRPQPLVELRRSFDIAWPELDAIDRGATAIDFDPAILAARSMAMVEDRLVFHGLDLAEREGMISSASQEPIPVDNDAASMLPALAKAVTVLQRGGVEGPYALVLGTRWYTEVIEGMEGGYPVLEHLRLMLDGGTVNHAPALEDALVLSVRGGDFELVVGEDLSIGFADRTSEGVTFFLEETILFRVNGPEAAVPLQRSRSSAASA